ncbi:phage head closure protein [Pseudomonas mosselii]|uniref:phage head closure protein n=1 Tax=Pseudomonas mosselii TaxID=78327 RepID=UPI001E283117|nr:phage head closure protein [Pseudomonas mosselii]MCL8303231.1 phage head closure protein [Pseudomonas mosselii]MCL8343246.1 phage head closure protein [Pseudomonas mosselii]MEB5934700.1 phage head closure protein [Pseudomonas mosselii]WJR27779.1 phage head closure protein [Pseudomonas mosselii]WJR30091.1 phage head closure protein [Pseudomonas mosselii]
MKAGDLRHPIQLQHKVTPRDPVTGEFGEPEWQLFAAVWAQVVPMSARDRVDAQAQQSEATGRMVIRYRPGVDSTMRIIYRGEIYSIEGPPLEDPKSGLEYLTLLVSKGVKDGQ